MFGSIMVGICFSSARRTNISGWLLSTTSDSDLSFSSWETLRNAMSKKLINFQLHMPVAQNSQSRRRYFFIFIVVIDLLLKLWSEFTIQENKNPMFAKYFSMLDILEIFVSLNIRYQQKTRISSGEPPKCQSIYDILLWRTLYMTLTNKYK